MLSVNTRLVGFVIWIAWLAAGSQSDGGDTEVNRTVDCTVARNECQNDFQCALAMFTVFGNSKCSKALGYDSKNDHIVGPAARVCPRVCALAIYNLTSLPKGKLLQDCECVNRDSICLTLKARMGRCMNTLYGPVNRTAPGCTETRVNCSADTTCHRAQKHFLKQCTQMISGVECTDECKRSIDHMLSLPIGEGLEKCECDGYEEPYCRGIWAHYKALCFSLVDTSITAKHRPTNRTPYVDAGKSSGTKLLSPMSFHSAFTIVVLVYSIFRV